MEIESFGWFALFVKIILLGLALQEIFDKLKSIWNQLICTNLEYIGAWKFGEIFGSMMPNANHYTIKDVLHLPVVYSIFYSQFPSDKNKILEVKKKKYAKSVHKQSTKRFERTDEHTRDTVSWTWTLSFTREFSV